MPFPTKQGAPKTVPWKNFCVSAIGEKSAAIL